MNPIEHNTQAVRTLARVLKNEHNVDAIDALFAVNFKRNFPPPLPPGLPGFTDIGRARNRAFPDVVVTEKDLIATQHAVVEGSSAAATHNGEFMGIPPTGRKVRWTEIHIYRVEDGKIAEHWVELSMLQLLQQLGAIPSPQAK